MWPFSKAISQHFLVEQQKATEPQYSKFLAQDLIQEPSDYEAGMLTTTLSQFMIYV
jgi:hypothetical protein